MSVFELAELGAGVVLGELDVLSRPKAKSPIPWTGLLIFTIVILSLGRMHGLINRVIDLFVRRALLPHPLYVVALFVMGPHAKNLDHVFFL